MNNRERIQKITGVSILIGLAIVLTFISNYIPAGMVNINLTLIVIVIGACIYGPLAGLALGLVNGIITLIAPATLAVFFPLHPVLTILLCLLKTGLAGLVSGFIFKLFKSTKQEFLGTVISSIVVPIINTGLFIIGVLLFFLSVYGDATTLITLVLSVNFLIEFISIVVLSPVIYRIIKIISHRMEENKAIKEE